MWRHRGVARGKGLALASGFAPEAAIEAREVVFRYGKLRALDDLTLLVPQGTSFGLLGPNGSGKTTLLRLLVGRLALQSGVVRVLGETPSPRLCQQIGYMPQLSALYLELSVQ